MTVVDPPTSPTGGADDRARAVRIPDRWWIPALGALALAALFALGLLIRAGGDPSLLVHAGPPWTSAEAAPGSLTVQGANDAFDGQFFYRLGVAPWSRSDRVAGVTFDLPSLRNARWGYGALAWVASGGDRDLVPWALLGLNLAAAFAVGGIGGGLARASGRHAGWGLLFALWPGFAYSVSLDTSELVAGAFVLGGLLAVRHRRWPAAAALLVAAVLTRDTTGVVPVGLAVAAVWALRPAAVGPGPARRAALGQLLAGFVAFDAFVVWQLVARARFGALPLRASGDNNLSAPFGGFVRQLGRVLPPSGAAEGLRLVSMVAIAALIAAAAWAWARGRPREVDGTVVAWVGAVAVVALLNSYLWSGATAFMRAATEAGLLSILLLVRRATPRLLGTAAVGLAGLWVLTAVAQVGKLG